MRKLFAAVAVLCVLSLSTAAAEKPKSEKGEPRQPPAANDPDAVGFSRAVRKAIRSGVARTLKPNETPTDAILAILRDTDGGKTEGNAYRLTTGNLLDESWVIQTPNWWGKSVNALPVVQPCTAPHCQSDFQMPRCNTNVECESPTGCAALKALKYWVGPPDAPRVCVGHSDLVMDEFYQRIADAQQSLDFSTLSWPTGRFLTALQYGIAYLADTGRPVNIRIVIGFAINERTPSARDILETFVRFAHNRPQSRLRVGVAVAESFDDLWDYWNHSKIMANEGEAVVGGHNLFMGDYLLTAPVHDLSMRVKGPAATTAHRFLDPIWNRYGCYGDGAFYDGRKDRIEKLPQTDCLKWPQQPPAPAQGSTKILSVGNYSRSVYQKHVPTYMADVARVAAFEMATDTIRIAQQDIGFRFGKTWWPEETLDALMDAALRGVHVYIVHTNVDAVSGAGVPYYNGIPPKDLVAKLMEVASTRPGRPKGKDELINRLCENVHLAPIRFTESKTWPNKIPPALHAKLWIVDDKLFFIGSDNIYPAWLYEFGYIVDGPPETKALVERYWNPLWEWSKTVAYSGSGAPTCQFRTNK